MTVQSPLKTEKENISIHDVAERIKTSEATIRNWIKTGYLQETQKGWVGINSLIDFETSIAGKEKLTKRANKSLKDSHDHQALTTRFLSKIIEESADNLGALYQTELSDSYQNQEGIYYTPEYITYDMLKFCDENLAEKTFLDPCCGSGNFIMAALKKGFAPENIYGFDNDEIAVSITKKRIFEKTGYHSQNIQQADFLEPQKIHASYDYIFTNPPWGKKFNKQQKSDYGSHFNTGKSLDSSALFFFACLELLNENGQLGFLLPEAFFNIANFYDARAKALDYQILALHDYGKSFDGLLTKAQAIILKNTPTHPTLCPTTLCHVKNSVHHYRDQKSFAELPKKIFNFHCQHHEVIQQIYDKPHLTLKNHADWGLGIVTGNNSKFIKQMARHNDIAIYKGADITKQGLKPVSCYIPKDMSLYQQTAPLALYQANEKIIYKFISNNLCFYCDTVQSFILNSANMLVLHDEFPLSHRQLTALLNSDIMNWLYQNIFNSHKILRADLEALPIHHEFFMNHDEFCEDDYLDYLGLEKMPDGGYHMSK